MIDLFSSDTPNGKKISIMLEEIGFEYAVKKMDLSKGDQFKDCLLYTSPSPRDRTRSRMPSSA